MKKCFFFPPLLAKMWWASILPCNPWRQLQRQRITPTPWVSFFPISLLLLLGSRLRLLGSPYWTRRAAAGWPRQPCWLAAPASSSPPPPKLSLSSLRQLSLGCRSPRTRSLCPPGLYTCPASSNGNSPPPFPLPFHPSPFCLFAAVYIVFACSLCGRVTAMALVWEYGEQSGFQTWKGLSWGMVSSRFDLALFFATSFLRIGWYSIRDLYVIFFLSWLIVSYLQFFFFWIFFFRCIYKPCKLQMVRINLTYSVNWTHPTDPTT